MIKKIVKDHIGVRATLLTALEFSMNLSESPQPENRPGTFFRYLVAYTV